MKINYISIFLLSLAVFLLSNCEKNEIQPQDTYQCSFSFADSSASHPKAAIYQEIIDRNQKNELMGVSLMVKDRDGVWLGASGKADLASNLSVNPCNPFLIASISKVFTAASIFVYVDQGKLSIEDSVTKWLPASVTDRMKNANESQIKHLLAHTSGIADYYTTQFELDRLNNVNNHWTHEEILTYAYGKNPTHEVGETYYYSNSNYLLLGMILEAVSNKNLREVYHETIFDPLGLESAYFITKDPLPDGIVKGYVDLYGDGKLVESSFLYKDEMSTGDGGIAINAYDLGFFMEALMKGQIISTSSLSQMTDWFDLPEGWEDETFGHFQNGYGLERQKTPYGTNVGHTGGIDGFLTVAQYFPVEDMTIILLINQADYEMPARVQIYDEVLEEMFE
ncbi:MAG: serine hydrolase [Bacteroidetes bacterium]|nr:serine hydrolase [Bacteroidota bacterium]